MGTELIKTNKVLVAASSHPLRAAIVDYELEEGFTIFELLSIAQPDSNLYTYTYIEIDGIPVPKNYWNLVKPRAGHLVSINVVPTGGDTLRTILTIGVIAASFYFGGPLGAAIVGSSTFTIGGAVIASSVIGSAIITVAGGLLINLIAPIEPAGSRSNPNKAESPSYFIDQARNTIRPYDAVPVIFGRTRVVPPLGAQTVTEVIGGDQYLRMLVVWGYGPLRISDIKIGNTPITEFNDVEIETREGRVGDAALTLYSNSIDQDNLNITLENKKADTDPDISVGGQWTTRRSGLNADELSIDITFPRGIAKFDDKGKRKENSIKLEIQYKEVTNNRWEGVISDVITASYSTDWITDTATGQIAFKGARTQPIRHGIRWSTGTKGQYDIRLRKFDYDTTNDRVYDIAIWSAIRTINNDSPINFPRPLAVSALRIRATNQLAGAVSELNAIVESESLLWDSTAKVWTPGYTSNPASMFRLAVQHPARRTPEIDANIDLVKLVEFYTFCEDKGYTFNDIHDQKLGLWDMLSNICAVGRASPLRLDNKFSVVVDTGIQMVSQHFTPVNSSDFKFYRSFVPPVDGIKIVFANEDNIYYRDERIVYNDGKDDTNSKVIPELSPTGITNKDHAYKFGRFHIAQSLLRREVWTLSVSFEYLVAQRGSRVTVQHDAIAVGIASARITEIITNVAGNVTAIKIDVPIYLNQNISYSVKIRTLMNAHIVKPINERDGEYQTFTFTTTLNESLNVDDIVSVGESGYVTIDGLIMAVEATEDLTARLSIVPYQADIYMAETGLIPAFNSGIAPANVILPTLVIIAVYSDAGAARLIGDVYEPGIYIVITPIDYPGAIAECEIRPNGTEEPFRPATIRHRSIDNIEVGNVEVDGTYDLRLRWTALAKNAGNWTEYTAQVVSGNLLPPAPISFTITEGVGKARLYTWELPDIPDLAGFRIKFSNADTDVWDDMGYLGVGLLTSSPYETSQPKAAGTYTFEIRTIDTAGQESETGVRTIVILNAVEEALDGTQWHSGLGPPIDTLGEDGDFYINNTNSDIYEKKMGIWTTISNLSGADGAIWFSGTGVPASDLGNVGDFYFRTSNAGIYKKTGSSTWTFQLDIDGEDGATWHTGPDFPASSLGEVGDFYFRQSNGYVYEKTAVTTWSYRADLTGPQGLRGVDGTQWYSGSGVPGSTLGRNGDFYIRNTTNVVYKKINGTWTIVSDLSGADGAVWFSGSRAPSGSLGNTGDFYFRTSNAGIYKKTGSSTWTFQLDVDGADGAVWHTGSGVPSSGLGEVGDFYFRQSNGFVYEKTTSRTWTYRADITGPQGLRGADGTQWYSGTGTPSSGLGANGDFYIRTTTNVVYKKISGRWTVVSDLSGADGANWFSGSAAPRGSLGNTGDFYFRTSNAGIYKKTGSSTWTFQLDVDGADGAVWHTGVGVPASSLGEVGDFYFRTSNGFVYEKTISRTWTYRADITGPQGLRGADGTQWYSGSTTPSSVLGSIGDFYIRTTTNVVYKKAGSRIWAIVSDLSGADGADGANWFSGSGLPSSVLGKVGDFYFRTSNAGIYKKAGSRIWTFQLDVDGADGAVWHTGSGVPSSVLGSIRDFYFRTSNGFVYEKTSSRIWTYRADITGPQGPAGSIPRGTPRTNTISATVYKNFYSSPVTITTSTYTLISFTYKQTGATDILVGALVMPYATSSRVARIAFSSEGNTSNSDPIFMYGYWSGRSLYLRKGAGTTIGSTAFRSAAIIKTTT